MASRARRLARLVPAILCVLWSFLLVPASATPTQGAPASSTAAPGLPASSPIPRAPSPAGPHAGPSEPRLAPAAVVGLPAAVEIPVRFPAAPAAPPAASVDLSVPARGLLAGDPRRERAPPGGPHGPRESRGPPSTRHS
ncbi:hypothetical protein ACF07V_18090 [Streptomyces sp. NPDC015661]|uniref:hypothetical protein n=1 Tax=Streptomyces sp. NPDC015661 TaxID=3364961 RepID=UPI00370169DF